MVDIFKYPKKTDIDLKEEENCNEYIISAIEIDYNGVIYDLTIEAKVHFSFELYGGHDTRDPSNHSHSEELEISNYQVCTLCGECVDVNLDQSDLIYIFNSII